jgi:hypothetical protein
MDTDEKIDAVRDIVQSIVSQRLRDIRIVSVAVRPDVDQDGDDVYFVDIVVDAGGRRLDPRETTGLIRRIRPEMAAIGETGFPVLSFIAESEMNRSRGEIA